MTLCNVSAESPTAACITNRYELPGSLLKLICDEWVSALNGLQRVAFPTVSSWLPLMSYTTAGWSRDVLRIGIEMGARREAAVSGMASEENCVHATKGDAKARGSPHSEEAHPSQCLRSAALVALPPLFREGSGYAGRQPVFLWVWGSLLLPVCHH
jgi:hypothetical protein